MGCLSGSWEGSLEAGKGEREEEIERDTRKQPFYRWMYKEGGGMGRVESIDGPIKPSSLTN